MKFPETTRDSILSAGTPPAIWFAISKICEQLDLFNTHPNIDIPFHAIGGILIARGLSVVLVKKMQTQWILGGTLLVGIIWEIYEVLLGLPDTGLTANTLQDVIMDMLGALGYVAVQKLSTDNTLVPIEIDPKTK